MIIQNIAYICDYYELTIFLINICSLYKYKWHKALRSFINPKAHIFDGEFAILPVPQGITDLPRPGPLFTKR